MMILNRNQFVGFTYGVASSGKSTLARYVLRYKTFPNCPIAFPDANFVIVSSDGIREELYDRPLEEVFRRGLDDAIEKRVWRLFEDRIIGYLAEGYDVLADSTFLKKMWRLNLISTIKYRHPKRLTFFLMMIDVPLPVIEKWNKQRARHVPSVVLIDMYKQRYDPILTVDLDLEKWDFIYYYQPLVNPIPP